MCGTGWTADRAAGCSAGLGREEGAAFLPRDEPRSGARPTPPSPAVSDAPRGASRPPAAPRSGPQRRLLYPRLQLRGPEPRRLGRGRESPLVPGGRDRGCGRGGRQAAGTAWKEAPPHPVLAKSHDSARPRPPPPPQPCSPGPGPQTQKCRQPHPTLWTPSFTVPVWGPLPYLSSLPRLSGHQLFVF